MTVNIISVTLYCHQKIVARIVKYTLVIWVETKGCAAYRPHILIPHCKLSIVYEENKNIRCYLVQSVSGVCFDGQWRVWPWHTDTPPCRQHIPLTYWARGNSLTGGGFPHCKIIKVWFLFIRKIQKREDKMSWCALRVTCLWKRENRIFRFG